MSPRSLVFVLAAACLPQHAGLKPPAVDKPYRFDAAAIDAWVAAEVENRGAVGAALVVVRDGKTLLARGYGVRKVGTREPIDADTPFAIGSVSKQFTCAAALALADDGKLAMTDHV